MSERADSEGQDLWAAMTWDDLEQWAGPAVLGRGRGYHMEGHVVALARGPDGTLSGRVSGTELYTTWVTRETGDLSTPVSSRCSCPYAVDCKHAVAVVLEYLERLKAGDDVPDRLPDDLASDGSRDAVDWQDHQEEPSGAKSDEQLISEYVEGLTTDELVDLIKTLAQVSEEGQRLLLTRARINEGDTGAIVRAARAELRRVTAEPGWYDHWGDEGHLPDYSHVRAHLESLLEREEADAVLELGREVLELGNSHVELSHDEGETGLEIGECLDVVWQAVAQSSLDPAQRILWLVDRVLEDEYDLCPSVADSGAWDADPATWGQVADALLARLGEVPAPVRADGGDWTSTYRRDRIVRQAIHALDNADRSDEALALCLREAPITQSYERAVRRLMSESRLVEARRLADEGIAKTQAEWPGIAAALRDCLREMAIEEGDPALAAAFVADAFFRRPSLDDYGQLKHAAERAEVWSQVRRCVLDALRTGVSPTEQQGWPLPDTGLDPPPDDAPSAAPYNGLLTEIALEENDHERAIKWYRKLRRESRYGRLPGISERLASEIASSHPDESIAIWQDLAASQIARVNRRGYQDSLRYLRPMRDLLTSLGRRDEWETYLAELREEHRRKRTFLATLDRLDERRIVDT